MYSKPWSFALRLAVALLLILVSAFRIPASARAAVSGGRYNGLSTDLSDVSLMVSADGSSVYVVIRYQPNQFGPLAGFSPDCPGGVELGSVPLVGDSATASFPALGTQSGEVPPVRGPAELNIKLDVRFSAGFATGSYSSDLSTSYNCPLRNMTFRTILEPPASGAIGGATYRGTTAEGYPFSFRVSPDGTKPVDVRLETGDPCLSISTGSQDLRAFTNGVDLIGGQTAAGSIGRFVLYVDGQHARGYLAVHASCASLSSTFSAEADPGPSATPPPQGTAAAGGELTGTMPANGGIALVVWSGGNVDAIATVASGRGCRLQSVWSATGDNFVGYIVGAPAFVQAPFLSRFAGGVVPPRTALVIVCASPAALSGTQIWRGSGRSLGATELFVVGEGWEYCSQILSGPPDQYTGMRASLYTADGIWVTSDSGAGGPGTLGCKAIPAAGRYQVKVFVSPEAVSWEVLVRPIQIPAGPIPQLGAWITDYIVPLRPVAVTGSSYTFEMDVSGFTPRFRTDGKPWQFCWEFVAHPPTAGTQVTAPALRVELGFEDEPGQFGTWEGRDFSGGANTAPAPSGCIQMSSRQSGEARHYLLVRGGSSAQAVRFTVSGVIWLG